MVSNTHGSPLNWKCCVEKIYSYKIMVGHSKLCSPWYFLILKMAKIFKALKRRQKNEIAKGQSGPKQLEKACNSVFTFFKKRIQKYLYLDNINYNTKKKYIKFKYKKYEPNYKVDKSDIKRGQHFIDNI